MYVIEIFERDGGFTVLIWSHFVNFCFYYLRRKTWFSIVSIQIWYEQWWTLNVCRNSSRRLWRVGTCEARIYYVYIFCCLWGRSSLSVYSCNEYACPYISMRQHMFLFRLGFPVENGFSWRNLNLLLKLTLCRTWLSLRLIYNC